MGSVTLKTETEHMLFKYLSEEKTQRKQLESLVEQLKSDIETLQQQLKCSQEKSVSPAKQSSETKAPPEPVQYETDEEELANETQWIRQQNRKKRKLNQSLTPPQKNGASSNEGQQKAPKVKKTPQPPPIIVENIKNYQKFYDFLTSTVSGESFLIKMRNGDSVKINSINEESYKAITTLLLQNNCLWHSYENKQDRPIRVMAKSLHSSCVPARVVEDLLSKGYKIQDAVNKLSWRNKEPLNMFMLSFNTDEDIKKIYNIKSILGCKVEIEPLRSSKLIPQCKRCQAYGHTQKYCSKEPRCVKCTGKHFTKDCKKPAEAKPKCVHCGEPHPANYRGCMVAKELQHIKNKATKKINVTPTIQVPKVTSGKNTSQLVTNSQTFAQVTKARQAQPQVQQQSQPQTQQTSLDSKVSKILSILTSFDERLKKLEYNARTAVPK